MSGRLSIFSKKNDLANTPPKLVRQHHFEAIIFKKGIKPNTRGFYFKQLRVFWNKLLEWGIVENNYLKAIKKDLPDEEENIRPKMLSKKEFEKLFKSFDDELKRKRARPDWDESLAQHWFKPVMAIYFYCGFRKNELCFDSDLDYSGLQGRNLQYHNDELAILYLPPQKGVKNGMFRFAKSVEFIFNRIWIFGDRLNPMIMFSSTWAVPAKDGR
jgi:hypothetical protein